MKKKPKKEEKKPVLLFPRDVEMMLLFLEEIRNQLIPMSMGSGPDGIARRLALHNLNSLVVSLRGR